jgi:hypothetical protein
MFGHSKVIDDLVDVRAAENPAFFGSPVALANLRRQ